MTPYGLSNTLFYSCAINRLMSQYPCPFISISFHIFKVGGPLVIIDLQGALRLPLYFKGDF